MRRRALLATTAAALSAMAGCGSGGTDGGNGSTDGGGGSTDASTLPAGAEPASEATATATDAGRGEPLAEAPIAADLAAQPRLGPDPTVADSVIVDVSDPSCPTCRSHHQSTFPTLRADLIDAGRTAYVVLNVGFVYDWGTDASAVLEAVHHRAPDAYWRLLDFYFDNQGRIGSDNYLAEARAHLADAPVDADAVAADVEAGAYDDSVARDESTARNAGVTGVPHFFLFRDGRLRTDFAGVQNAAVFERALGY